VRDGRRGVNKNGLREDEKNESKLTGKPMRTDLKNTIVE